MGPRRRRLGVALLVPPPLDREIDALRSATGDHALGRIPAHVTLVPPVNVHRRDLEGALALVRDAAAGCPPLTLDLGPPDTFLPDNPVLHLPVGGDVDELMALRDGVWHPPLERKLSWPYVPHVTLCDQGEPDRVEAAARGLARYRRSVTVESVHLLAAEGGVWRPVADAALSGRRVIGRGGLELELTESEQLEPEARAFTDDQWAQLGEEHGGRWDERPWALTARRDGVIVGTANGWTNEGVAHLAELMVAAGVRREGVGGHLLAAFEDLASRRGCPRLSLRTDAGGPAQGFYEAWGWHVEATFDDWVDGRTTVQMRKDL